MDRLILSFFAFFLLFVSKFFYSLNYCMTSFHLRYVFDQHFDFNERNFNCLLVLSTECVCVSCECVCVSTAHFIYTKLYICSYHITINQQCAKIGMKTIFGGWCCVPFRVVHKPRWMMRNGRETKRTAQTSVRFLLCKLTIEI